MLDKKYGETLKTVPFIDISCERILLIGLSQCPVYAVLFVAEMVAILTEDEATARGFPTRGDPPGLCLLARPHFFATKDHRLSPLTDYQRSSLDFHHLRRRARHFEVCGTQGSMVKKSLLESIRRQARWPLLPPVPPVSMEQRVSLGFGSKRPASVTVVNPPSRKRCPPKSHGATTDPCSGPLSHFMHFPLGD